MPRPSTASPPRCRHCGAPLAGGKFGRACPRCHPEEAAIASQLEMSFSAPPPNEPPAPTPAVPETLTTPAYSRKARIDRRLDAAPAQPQPTTVVGPTAPPPKPASSAPNHSAPIPPPAREPSPAVRFFSIASGSLIVLGGLSWATFQMWPRGPVEQAIVREIEALPHFAERAGAENPLGSIVVEGESSPVFVDLDGDGKLDLVTGSRSGEIRVFRNAGTRQKPRFVPSARDGFGLVPTDTSNVIAFADLRGVNLPDAVNVGTSGTPSFFQNRGNPQHPEFVLLAPEDDPFAVTVAPKQSYDWRATFADIDRDGDLDLFVGTRDGTILFFENRGTGHKPQFAGVTRVAPFGLRGLGELVSLSFGDLDGDGDLDAVAGNAAGELLFAENRGNAWRPKFTLMGKGALGLPQVGRDATVALADLDGDGDLDCVVGGADGRFRYFENLSTPVPKVAPVAVQAKAK